MCAASAADRARDQDALERGRAWCRREPADRLVLRGADVEDLLHRIAASEIRELGNRELRPLLFTDDKGRVVDLAQATRADDHYELYCGRGRGAALRAWIERWVITEDVSLTEGGSFWDLFGDEALAVASSCFEVAPPPPGATSAAERARILRPSAPLGSPAMLTLDPASGAHELETDPGRAIVAVNGSAVDAWCVRHGFVHAGPALAAAVNPLELGWKDLVAWTKGCYIGQEVVARLDTYDKVKRHVVTVEGTGAAPAPGSELRSDGRRAGSVLLATELVGGNARFAGGNARLAGETALLAVVDRGLAVGAPLTWDEGAGTVSTIPASTRP